MEKSRWAPKPVKEAALAATVPAPAAEPVAVPATEEPVRAPIVAPAPIEPDTVPEYGGYDPEDEFAQTRAPDDLFDDDFTPMAEPVVEDQPPPPAEPPQPEPVPAARKPRGPRRGGGVAGVSSAQGPGEKPATAGTADVAKKVAAATRTSAVRGDRSATGGPKREKLTEEELTAKLQAMQLKNETLLKAHARAEADLASFQKREAEAARRQAVDRQNRQQMMGEREKNRQRKLKAVGGREWDAEKKEEDFADTRRPARRGAHGGVVGGHPAPAAPDAEAVDEGVRGQGSRGRGRGRGGRGREGRGGKRGVEAGIEKPAQERQAPPTASDFPDLPATSKEAESEVHPPTKLDFPIKLKQGDKPLLDTAIDASIDAPGGEKKSWADQVEGTPSPQ